MNERENYLRAITFGCPERTPAVIGFAPATWKKYREGLEELVLRYPALFPGCAKGGTDFDHAGRQASQLEPDGPTFRNAGEYYRDSWGCLWHCGHDGLGGQPVEHPLADWTALKAFRPPDILRKTRWGADRQDWDDLKRYIEDRKKKGELAHARIPCFFDRLHYLRGFENLLCDFVTNPPELATLIEMVLDTNMKIVSKLLELGLDVVDHHGDIGTQRSLMMSPAAFRQYLKPGYARMFAPFRKAGIPVRYSSDGYLLEIVDDMIECGISSHDPQFTVNTLAGIVQAYKGKLCAVVDFGQELALLTPPQIRACIAETIRAFDSPQGGLVLRVWTIPDVPLSNIEAFCAAAMEFCAAPRL